MAAEFTKHAKARMAQLGIPDFNLCSWDPVEMDDVLYRLIQETNPRALKGQKSRYKCCFNEHHIYVYVYAARGKGSSRKSVKNTLKGSGSEQVQKESVINVFKVMRSDYEEYRQTFGG